MYGPQFFKAFITLIIDLIYQSEIYDVKPL